MPRITIRRTTLICVTIIVYVALKPKFSSDSDISTQVELDALVFNDYYFQSKNPEKYKPKLSKPWTPKKIRTVDTNSREYQILKEKEAFLHEAERRNAIMKTTSPLPRKCDQLPKNLDDYPHCRRRLLELDNIYRTNQLHMNQCFNDTEIEDEPCAFQAFLALYERSCPPLISDIMPSRKRDLRHQFNDFYKNMENRFSEESGEIGFDAINYALKRIQKYEESWLVSSFNMKQRYLDQPELREKKKILIHVSWIKSHFNMVSETIRIQFSDLLAGLFILGHTITIAKDIDEMLKFTGIKYLNHDFSKSCPESFHEISYDMIITDIHGAKTLKTTTEMYSALQNLNFKKRIRAKRNRETERNSELADPIVMPHVTDWDFIQCRLRILMEFPIDAEYNHPTYHLDEDSTKRSAWYGHLGLDIKQYLTPYPESDDNTFLGFTVHSTIEKEMYNLNEGSIATKTNVLIYGEDASVLAGKKQVLDVFEKHIEISMEIHSTLAENIEFEHFYPNYGINHENQNPEDFLNTTRILLGFGQPMEDYLPLEALSHGVVYLQDFYNSPLNKENSEFLKDRPNEIEFHTQNPYLESIGEPYVYSVDFNNQFEIKSVLLKILSRPVPEPIVPLAFQTLEYLYRLDAITESRDFCKTEAIRDLHIGEKLETRLSKIGGEMDKGHKGKLLSCSLTCKKLGARCDVDFFSQINASLQSENQILCKSFEYGALSILPAINLTSSVCYLQRERFLFNCRAKSRSQDLARFCPCAQLTEEDAEDPAVEM